MVSIQISENKVDGGWEFQVKITEQGSETNHLVTMSEDFYSSLGTQKTPQEIIVESFNFLLKREPKEQILQGFDITLISHYFPEFKEYISKI